jgi:ribosomal protein L11 methyltransferase
MVELLLLMPAGHVETASDALMELGALSVSVEDADADTPDEAPVFGEPGMAMPDAIRGWDRSVVKALFEDEPTATDAATLILAQPWGPEVHLKGLQPLDEQDWVRLTQSQFDPVRISDAFWIVPSWHQPPAEARHVIRLDPGLAFGTGTHPTTRMCLRWLDRHADEAPRWTRALDYGCGSGILAIGAAKWGAQAIDAVDVDPAAIQSTDDNAQANGVTLRAGMPDLAQGEYPLVMANILAAPLKVLAPALCAHLAPGGALILAGLLERQIDELKEAYAPWLVLEVADLDEGWALLCGRKPAST